MRRDYGPECTRELVEAVARQLATQSVRDSDFPETSAVNEEDTFVVVQGGSNRNVQIGTLLSQLNTCLDIDAIKDKLEDLNIQYNTTEYWNNKRGFIPKAGEIIIYSDYAVIHSGHGDITVPGIKIGSGNGYVQDLAFVGDYEASLLSAHIADSNIHTTAAQKNFWNRKLNVNDASEVVEETLVFNRN